MRPDRFPSDFQPKRYDEPSRLQPIAADGADGYLEVEYACVTGYRPLILDLAVPQSGRPAPLVVWIHGGAWRDGSHRPEPDGLIDITPLFQGLLDAGIAVASITYRHSAEAIFPAPLHDAKAAVRWLRRFGPDLGVDPDRIGVAGESAGGHLAALVAQPETRQIEGDEGVAGVPSTVKAAVCWYPPTDVTIETSVDDAVAQLFGGTPQERPALARAASPTSWVTADSAPLLLIHGDADSLVDVRHSEVLRDAYRAAGASVELDVVAGADHCFLGVDPQPVIDRTVAFFRDRL